MLTVMQYFWLVYVKTVMNYMMAGIFGVLSIIIIFAEIANIFDFQHNLIYDFFTSPEYDVNSPNYFYLSNVSF